MNYYLIAAIIFIIIFAIVSYYIALILYLDGVWIMDDGLLDKFGIKSSTMVIKVNNLIPNITLIIEDDDSIYKKNMNNAIIPSGFSSFSFNVKDEDNIWKGKNSIHVSIWNGTVETYNEKKLSGIYYKDHSMKVEKSS